jgi:DnaJ-class molecular chaperone
MGPDIDSIFRNFGFHFGQNPGGFGHFRQTQPRRNKDLRVAISISLESTLEPQTKTISVQTTNGQRQTVEVNIPRGIQNGSVMKYPDLGDNFFNTLPRGDLYVEFRVETHPVFRVHGRDLLLGVEINCFDAITGGETEIHSLDGKTFLLQIPAGTQSGTVMRIKEQGLYSTDRADRGNLLVEVVVRIPTNLSEEQLNLIQQIKSSQ